MTDTKQAPPGIPPDLDWIELLLGKSWEAAMPSSLSNARLEHVWRVSCQPPSRWHPLMFHLMTHIVEERNSLPIERLISPDMQDFLKVMKGLTKLVSIEREARCAAQSFLTELDEVCGPLTGKTLQERAEVNEPDCEDVYRTAYAHDQASTRVRQMCETVDNFIKDNLPQTRKSR